MFSARRPAAWPRGFSRAWPVTRRCRAALRRPLRCLTLHGREFFFKGGDAAGLDFAGRLFFAQQASQFLKLQFECTLGALAVLEPGIEFALAQGEDMGAQVEVRFALGSASRGAVKFLLRPSAAFLERLHPERFGDVRDRFGQTMQGRRAGIEARGQPLPPGIEERIDGVGGAAADSLADLLNRRALALAQAGIGSKLHIPPADPAGGCAVAGCGGGWLCHVLNNTAYIN